jgi:hypothetical protein
VAFSKGTYAKKVSKSAAGHTTSSRAMAGPKTPVYYHFLYKNIEQAPCGVKRKIVFSLFYRGNMDGGPKYFKRVLSI